MRGLKLSKDYHKAKQLRRTPGGVRGLKHPQLPLLLHLSWSHPARGAWIETYNWLLQMQIRGSLTPPGVRALKRKVLTQFKYESRCRTPPGVHALKRRLNRHYRARKRGASRDKDIPLFDLMELFIIGINEHNSPFFSLLAFFYTTF